MRLSDKHSSDATPPGAAQGPLARWSDHPDTAIETAITRWSLNRVGWRGFEGLPWVTALKEKYPDVDHIAHTCTIHDNKFKKQVPALLDEVAPEDLCAVQSYFVGKLALEELSCRANGSMAGLCDKRAAYMQIFDMLKDARAAT